MKFMFLVLVSLMFLSPMAKAQHHHGGNNNHNGNHYNNNYNYRGPIVHNHVYVYPGYHSGWQYNRNWYPQWYRPGYVFPPFVWMNVPYGYWHCTAFNQYNTPYSQVAVTQNQAAYNALYSCGGVNYMAAGCYIPAGYCQFR